MFRSWDLLCVIGSSVKATTVRPSGRCVVEGSQKLCVTGFAVLSGSANGTFSKGKYSPVFENRNMVLLLHADTMGQKPVGCKIYLQFSFVFFGRTGGRIEDRGKAR